MLSPGVMALMQRDRGLEVKEWRLKGSVKLISVLAHDRREQGERAAAGLCEGWAAAHLGLVLVVWVYFSTNTWKKVGLG